MKRFILILLGVLVFETGMATQATFDNSILGVAKEQVMNMQNQVHFNEFEYIKILKLMEKRIVDIKEANNLYYGDKELLTKSIKMINYDFDKEVLSLLNPTQKKAYKLYKLTENDIATVTARQ